MTARGNIWGQQAWIVHPDDCSVPQALVLNADAVCDGVSATAFRGPPAWPTNHGLDERTGGPTAGGDVYRILAALVWNDGPLQDHHG